MKPPYDLTNKILHLLTSISEKIGTVNAVHLEKPAPNLRKKNRVKTIKASLEIEGNTLSEAQITAIIEKKRVIGPEKDITEVVNAIEVYERLPTYHPFEIKSFLEAHACLMKGLIKSPGNFRTKSVGIFKGKELAHMAPPAENLNFLMKDLFSYLKKSDDPMLIKSCVAHYEIEFIHPFMDGNGRMGRLWQTLLLMKTYPLFEFLPFETLIKDHQSRYYDVLEQSDKEGKSTRFIEFILGTIDESLRSMVSQNQRILTPEDRIEYFLSSLQSIEFTRKDYLQVFKNLSSATASRDLKIATDKGLITKHGDKRLTKYLLIQVNG